MLGRELKDQLEQLFDTSDVHRLKVTVQKTCKGYNLHVVSMYDPPKCSYTELKALGDLFGTDLIDVDGYARAGCETCDYGSSYGHDISLRKVTKNEEALIELCAG